MIPHLLAIWVLSLIPVALLYITLRSQRIDVTPEEPTPRDYRTHVVTVNGRDEIIKARLWRHQ